MNLLVFAGALRKDSFNKKLAREAMRLLESKGETAKYQDLKEFDLPLYDGDNEDATGVPKDIEALGAMIKSADAIVISTPEYNGGISSVLKTVIDWLSRMDPVPIEEKPVLLLGASPGALGAVRGLWHTRVPLEAMAVFVFPEMFGLSKASEAFDEQGKLKDPKTEKRLSDLLSRFVEHARPRKE